MSSTSPLGPGSAALEGVLELIQAYQARRCEEIRAEAEAQMRAQIQAAHREVRRRARQAIVTVRHRHAERLAAVRAELETQTRSHQLELQSHLVARAWSQLRQVLLERWAVPETRRGWVVSLARQALHQLPRSAWTVRHPRDWNHQELAAELPAIQSVTKSSVHWEADPGLIAGLHIQTDRVSLDGTLDGLLSDRARLQARLLHHVQCCIEETRHHG